jgi:hypothetical protein
MEIDTLFIKQPLKQENLPNTSYHVKIRQEPTRGRMCGLGDAVSRRMLDPPLILQIDYDSIDNNSSSKLSNLATQLVCHVNIKAANDDTNMSFLALAGIPDPIPPEQLIRTMLGQSTTAAQMLRDVDGSKKLFFVFPDLAIRIQGEYRIECHIMNIKT